MDQPLVTVAMSMRDSERTLGAALESLLAQSYPHWELLLVDDGSRDGSVRLAERFADPRIRILADGRGLGLAARLNQVVARACGKYIARMDADDVSYPERFRLQVDYLEAHPEVDLLGAGAVVFQAAGEPVGRFPVQESHEAISARPWAGFYLPHPTWMGRAAWFRARRYDERSKTEDQALLLGAYRSSRFAALPQPLLGYRQDAIPLRKVWRGRYDYCRALLGAAPSVALRGIPGHAAKLAVEAVAIGTGLERTLLGHRAQPLAPRDAERWLEVWTGVQEALRRRGVDAPAPNRDAATVDGFGREWSRFDRGAGSEAELAELFERYFRVFPWHALPAQARGFDLGCGSGRWARLVAPRVGRLHCIDASREALEVARRNLAAQANCEFHAADVGALPLGDASMDFGYSLGVLHHVPDTAAGVAACARKLKAGAPFLIYLYYALDNRPWWFRALWRASDPGRRVVSALPFAIRARVTDAIAALVYWPLARAARLAERAGANAAAWPLAQYRSQSFYVMRNDALDRFGTPLEKRFTREQIRSMLEDAGLERVCFSEDWPFWCAVAYRASGGAGG